MKILALFLILMPGYVLAHCPSGFKIDGVDYCSHVQWVNGEEKSEGKLGKTEKMSPQLMKMGDVPQKWIYSKMQIRIWKKGDISHAPQKIENFRVFPYMFMKNGHHHSASYKFDWDSKAESYGLRAVVFQQMPGCWTLRWTIQDSDTVDSSKHYINVLNYANLSEKENSKMAEFCKSMKQPSS